MKDNVKKQVQEELFLAFESLYTKARLRKIAERYNFTENLDKFKRIVEETFYGNLSIKELSKTLQNELDVSTEVAQYIEIELDQELFSTRRLEFNIAQGFVSPDEITFTEETGDETAGAEDFETKPVPTPQPNQKKDNDAVPQKDPVAGSILGNNNNHSASTDPYREPIDE